MKFLNRTIFVISIAGLLILQSSCNYVTHRTFSGNPVGEDEEPEPDYRVSLNESYQDFVTYMFMGNRVKSFSTYFNVFYTAESDYNSAIKDIRASTIAAYNRRLDSLNITPPVTQQVKDKFNKVIERASKVIQFSKNTRFIDDAVLLIGESYYYMQDYYQAERTLGEFFSKFESSRLRDRASLYLGRTKLKLGQGREAESIFRNLVDNSQDNSIRSDAAFDLGIYYLTQRNQDEALKYLNSSVEYSRISSLRAEKQFILARIYSRFKPELSAAAYRKAIDLSSDFDLKFYSQLNYCKALIEDGNFRTAQSMLNDMTGDYRDYPEYRQLIDLEIANNYLAQGNFERAKIAYFNVIVDFPGSVSASDAYYFLANYYENTKNDYLNAIVNYRKSNQENPSGNYSSFSSKKAQVLDKYFTLQSQANNTEKGTIPTVNEELENYRTRRLQEKGIEQRRDGQFDNRGNTESGKGGGFSSVNHYEVDDSLKGEEQFFDDEFDGRERSGKEGDDKQNMEEERIRKPKDTGDEMRIEEETSPVKTQDQRFNALFQLSELFLYELNYPDSAEYYLDIIIREDTDTENISKAYYTKALIIKNNGKPAEANDIFNKIIMEFPNSVFANESRKQLGKEVVEVNEETIDEQFSGVSAGILNLNYEQAISELHKLIATNTDSLIVSRGYYTLGWIYENGVPNKDSVMHYYSLIMTLFPFSEYYQTANEKLIALGGGLKPDEIIEETSEEPGIEEEDVKEEYIEGDVKKEEEYFEKEKPDENEHGEDRLSPEELERLLKELEEEGN